MAPAPSFESLVGFDAISIVVGFLFASSILYNILSGMLPLGLVFAIAEYDLALPLPCPYTSKKNLGGARSIVRIP